MPASEVILNTGGGSCSDDTEHLIRDAFTEQGVEANISCAAVGSEIEALVEKAIASDGEVIVACGGDGTVSGIAAAVAEAGKTLGVLPLGTLNNFSKDLGIPQDLAEAVRIIIEGNTTTIDLAEVNGRVFINNSSIGLYPKIVREREQQQERLGHGKWRAAFWAALRNFRFSPFLKVRIEVDGKTFLRKTPFVFVGNNRYEMDTFNIGRRAALDGGKLSVYFLHRGGRFGVIMLLLRTLTGTVGQWRDFEEVLTETVTIQTRRRRLHVAFDGEVDVMETPLEFKILPQALKVISPRDKEENA